MDDIDRKSRHQTNRFPSFILRVQEKRKTSYELRKACVELQLHKSCGVLSCVKLETKDKSSLFELILTKFFLLREHNGMCWPTATFTDLEQRSGITANRKISMCDHDNWTFQKSLLEKSRLKPGEQINGLKINVRFSRNSSSWAGYVSFFSTRILMWSYGQFTKVTPNFPNISCYYGVLGSFFF